MAKPLVELGGRIQAKGQEKLLQGPNWETGGEADPTLPSAIFS